MSKKQLQANSFMQFLSENAQDEKARQMILENVISQNEFDQILRDGLTPVFNKYGFKGQKIHYKKKVNDTIFNCIGVNRHNRLKSAIQIELGVHYYFLEDKGEKIEFKNLKFNDCWIIDTIQKNKELNEDWIITKDKASNLEIFNEIDLAINEKMKSFFSIYNEFPAVFTKIKADDLKIKDHPILNHFVKDSPYHWCYLLCKIHVFLNDYKRAKEFAEIGLALMKNESVGSYAKDYFNWILKGKK